MTTHKEALMLAREYVLTHSIDAGKVFIAIEEALAQPEQEPFCWCIESQDSADWCFAKTEEGVKSNSVFIDDEHGSITDPFPLYTTPPQRTWVGLTDEERDLLRSGYQSGRIGSFVELCRAMEATLKEKNT